MARLERQAAKPAERRARKERERRVQTRKDPSRCTLWYLRCDRDVLLFRLADLTPPSTASSMAPTESSRWMPAPGRYTVNIGTSLARALKVRKGGATAPKRSTLPDRNFYSFRCKLTYNQATITMLIVACNHLDNFKPESIDPTKPGSINVRQGKEANTITVERPSSQVRFSSYRVVL
jgi:hypothetical protein